MIVPFIALLLVSGMPSEVGAFRGPGRACLMHSYIDLVEGETLKIKGAGTESARFRLRTPRGTLQLIESEIIGDGSYSGTAVTDDGQTRVFREGSGRHTRYLFHGRTDYSPDADRLTLILTGPRAEHVDARSFLMRRIHVAEPDLNSCKHSYRYGWEVISETLDQ